MGYAQLKEDLKDARADAEARIRSIVNEGAIARFVLKGGVGPQSVGSGMPEYMLEHHDHGLHEPKPYQPTPRQIDNAYLLEAWYGDHREPGRDKNGLFDWQWKILELRGWQEINGSKGGWRLIERQFNALPNGRSFSHERIRQIHGELVDTAFGKAIDRGYINI